MTSEIIHLNVGGRRFSTSRQTLTWVPDSFFTSLLSGRISSLRDETGAIFIDRDPDLFSRILHFLRTKEVDFKNVDLSTLRHESEFYGIAPLIRRLVLCEDLNHPTCGGVLFHSYLTPPSPPQPAEAMDIRQSHSLASLIESELGRPGAAQRVEPVAPNATNNSMNNINNNNVSNSNNSQPQPSSSSPISQPYNSSHSRNSSADYRLSPHSRRSSVELRSRGHSRNSSADLRHSRNSSWDLKNTRFDSTPLCIDPLRVTMLRGHHNWICIAYPHFVTCFRMKDSTGWHIIWTSPHMELPLDRVAINAKVMNPNQDNANKMVAASTGNLIRLWSVTDDGDSREIGTFNLKVSVDSLFFIGSQLVALSQTGKVGVWHAMTQHWQIQDVVPITSYDTAGSFLLLGCKNGSIYYIDMQKFPLRMKDNDLLVTELYKDPNNDMVTALSVYLTPKTSLSGNWIEIAYGTSSGTVRVIVQHPETVGHGPQLFQTFTVHRSPVTKVMLSEKHLVSVCSEYNHVRTWSVTRFRGMISTQPGSTPLASFKIVSLEGMDNQMSYPGGHDFDKLPGPFGEQDDQQVFVQRVVPETDQLFVRLSSNGQRVCVIKAVDMSPISAFCVHECEGSNRMGSRPRRYLFTGHDNGSIQMWDLTTAIEMMNKDEQVSGGGGPTPAELVDLLDQFDLSNSRMSTPCISPSPSVITPHGFQGAVVGSRYRMSGMFSPSTTSQHLDIGASTLDVDDGEADYPGVDVSHF